MKIHIVRPGDTMWDLAQKYNIPIERLLEANPQIQESDQLDSGAKVRIPTGRIPVTAQKRDEPAKTEPEKEIATQDPVPQLGQESSVFTESSVYRGEMDSTADYSSSTFVPDPDTMTPWMETQQKPDSSFLSESSCMDYSDLELNGLPTPPMYSFIPAYSEMIPPYPMMVDPAFYMNMMAPPTAISSIEQAGFPYAPAPFYYPPDQTHMFAWQPPMPANSWSAPPAPAPMLASPAFLEKESSSSEG